MRTLGTHIFVEPIGDSEKYPGSSLYIPASWANPEIQQGIVVASGPDTEVQPGQHLLFHPFRASRIRVDGRELFHVHQVDCACTVDGDGQLVPFSREVVVDPDFAGRVRDASVGIIIPASGQSDLGPVLRGTILRVGREVHLVSPGDYIVMEPRVGHEVGYIDQNYYILPEDSILARVENGSN